MSEEACHETAKDNENEGWPGYEETARESWQCVEPTADYELAVATAKKQGLKLPMIK
jgi:hypothetical protein